VEGRAALGRGLALGAAVLAGSAAAALALAWAVPLPARLAERPSTVVEFRDGQVAHVFLAPDQRWRPEVRLAEVDPAYLAALLRLEDRRFRWHPGVDPLAVARAALGNLAAGRRVSGASTLTMQLARVLEPRPRTLWSKAVEALRAMQLELRLGKEGVLRAYLQFAPYGGNVEGIEAASLAWFGHRPTALAPAEIAALLAVPQDPNRRAPSPANAARLRGARDLVARRLHALGGLPLGGRPAADAPAVLAGLLATPPPTAPRPFPREAPHAAAWLRAQAPGDVRIPTTLDAGAQRLAARILAEAAPELGRLGAWNGAAVLLDHASGEVRALVGNLDFWDGRHGGQVVAFAAPRSPGSALKPLLYALAVERGLAGPRTLVPDVPTAWGGYAPTNYDGGYDGMVTLEEALSRSLNVPFVNLLREVGVEPFLDALRAHGVRSLDPTPGHYGLSAAVGGLELTPLELAGVYGALAEGGAFRPPRVRRDEPAAEPARLLAPGAAWLTVQALSRRDRPDFPSRRQLTGAPARVHWKTGTSFGHRDAWAAGSGPAATAVVWIGNVDGTGARHLVGGEVAAPLLFDLLEGVADRAAPPPPRPPPPDLAPVEVCALSGRLPTPACPHRAVVPALRSSVPSERCRLHRQVDVELATGLALAPGCRDGRRLERRTFVDWPPSVRRWLRAADRALPAPPALAPGCLPGGPRRAPRVVSPAEGQVALLAPGLDPSEQEIPLEAEAAASGRLSWFVDGEFLGAAPADERLWWRPSPGRHLVVVTDEAGLSGRREVEVRARGR
jgi:penicillin-binding protein 1C